MAASATENVFTWAKSVDWPVYEKNAQVRTALEQLRALIAPADESSKSGSSSSSESSQAEDEGEGERIKLVVVGDGAVGKTSLLISYSQGRFPSEYVPTVFENYGCKKECEGHPVVLHLWDTAGQEDYDRLRPLSYPGSDVVLLIFATTSKLSFDAITDKWHPEISHYLPHTPFVLVGSKIDLRDEKLQDPNAETTEYVTTEQGKQLMSDIGAEAYMELSSKTGKGLAEVFHYAMRIVLEDRKIIGGAAAASPSGNAPKTESGTSAAASSSTSSASATPADLPARNTNKKPKPKKACILL